jgi:hypothetical protein
MLPSVRRKPRPEDFETCELVESFAFFAAIRLEVGAAVFRRRGQKMLKGKTQGVEFCTCNLRVVYEITCAKNADVNAGGRAAWKIRNGVDVDIERIDKEAAVWGVRARLTSALNEKGMQRVCPDTSGAARCCKRNNAREIAEIAVAPVSA